MTEMQKTKVLLVDDDGFFTKLYAKKAEKYPMELRVAGSGEEALKLLRSGTFTPDKILLDVNMPEMSGVDVLRAIREENLVPNATVSILSNTHESEFADDYRALKIDKFIPKTSLLPSQVLDLVVGQQNTNAVANA
jgi:CheY-like chemotaxis protein